MRMAKRNELAVWREKMASGGFESAADAGIALDQLARRRMFALSEAYDEAAARASAESDEYVVGACDVQANILRAIAANFK